jgi:hypothetical protein
MFLVYFREGSAFGPVCQHLNDLMNRDSGAFNTSLPMANIWGY